MEECLAHRLPGLLPDQRATATDPAAQKGHRQAVGHRDQQLQRRQWRRPEGRGRFHLLRTERKYESLRLAQAQAPLRN